MIHYAEAIYATRWLGQHDSEPPKVYIAPLLALPGWWLENMPARETRLCRVVNPKWLPGVLAKERPVLAQKQIDLIALRLEARCRDVEE